jgi:uncharacterized membrane protein YphA (DoxX/SURF4 family)
MTAASTRPQAAPPSRGVEIGLWTAQVVLAVIFVGGGFWKLATPIPVLAAKMPWMGDVKPSFLHMTAFFDVLGGVGVVLPAATRVKPGLTVLAAIGCVTLQTLAILFHFSRGEGASTPFNFLLFVLALFVAWGRSARAPIAPRA